jgi:hypothetical protein
MSSLPFPANFLPVTAASPSAFTGADGALYYSAFGRYGSDQTTQGVHVFRLPPGGAVTDLALPEARPLARGILCRDTDGIWLVAWSKDAGQMTRMKIADVPAALDPRVTALAVGLKALLGLK